MQSPKRSDNRSPTTFRPLQASFSHLERADGSARFSFGPVAALASFSGPIEVRLREELPDKASLEVTHRPLEGVGATPSRALTQTLTTLLPPLLNLSQHPRSLLQLVIQTLSPSPAATRSTSTFTPSSFSNTDTDPSHTWPPPDPSSSPNSDDPTTLSPTTTAITAPMSGMYFSARAAAINASILAILDAGSIGMKGVVVAVSLANLPPRSGRDGEAVMVVDPSMEEERTAQSRFGFGWAFGAGFSQGEEEEGEGNCELVWTESEGAFSRAEALGLSRIAALDVLAFIREKMEEHFKSRLRS